MPTACKSWKFLILKGGKITSAHNGNSINTRYRCTWEIGEWKHATGFIRPCTNGFHHSNNPYDALTYVSGDVLARVEVKGTRTEDDYGDANHKEACSDMRIVKAGAWGKNDSIGLALHVAGLAAAKLPAGNEYRKLAERGMAAVREYLSSGTPVPVSIVTDLRDCFYGTRNVAGVDFDSAYAVNPTYYAAYATQPVVSPNYAGSHAIYGISAAMDLIDGYDGQAGGTVKTAVNDWMENRFKTLPRF